MKNIVIIGASSDIGKAVTERFLEDGFSVVGTYRNLEQTSRLFDKSNLHLYPCDLRWTTSILEFTNRFNELSIKWDLLLFCVGVLTPIGEFFGCDFEEWAESVEANAISQLRILHTLYPYRKPKASVIFFGGGHRDRPFVNYSAYWVSKMMLNNMEQLLDKENNDLNVHVIETSWVNTKIHDQTLANPEGAGDNYGKTVNFLKSGAGTSMDEIYDLIKEAHG
jgi:NAD(P)-dependent dehydrogenase (short-subunit alcohol dehydrogenase family)